MEKSAFNLDFQNLQMESRIIAAFERISQAFRILLWEESKKFALSPIQVQALIFLLNHSQEKCKVSYLADEFNMAKPTISETVKILEQKGLIRRIDEPHDSRSKVIQLTSYGAEVAEKTSFFTRQIQLPVEAMTMADKEKLMLSLLNIIHHLNKVGIITIQRMCFTCTHYRENKDSARHFCQLLDKKMENSELRVDCPEHQTIPEAKA
jgi:DNA-binding MarR family transcriptional regulator